MVAKSTETTAEEIAALRPENCTPSDVAKLIDYRVDQITGKIAEHHAEIESLEQERKAWLSVTGGLSRLPAGGATT